MKIPKINWIAFDKNNPPSNISDERYLIFFRTDNYDNGSTWNYHMDIATPYGDYIDNFWDTETDWYEGQRIEVLAYAEIYCYLKEKDLEEKRNDTL